MRGGSRWCGGHEGIYYKRGSLAVTKSPHAETVLIECSMKHPTLRSIFSAALHLAIDERRGSVRSRHRRPLSRNR